METQQGLTNLAQKGQVKQNSQRAGVGSEDDELGNTAVQRLGGLVGTLLELVIMASLVLVSRGFTPGKS